MNTSTVPVVLGLIIIALLTAVVCLLLSIPLIDNGTPPPTTRAVAFQPTNLPTVLSTADRLTEQP